MLPVQDAFSAVLEDGLRGDDPKATTLCRSLDRVWPALWTRGIPTGDRRCTRRGADEQRR